MEPTKSENSASNTSLPTNRGSAIARLWPHRRWYLCGLALALVLTLLLLAMPRPAAACFVLNPICWVEEALDQLKDLLQGIATLMVDIVHP